MVPVNQVNTKRAHLLARKLSFVNRLGITNYLAKKEKNS